jgi:hypothetical protein
MGASLFFSGGDVRLQAFAQPPEEIEPAVAVLETKVHQRVTRIADDVELNWPAIDQLLQ